MRCRQNKGMFVQQFVKYGLGKGSALGRVCTRAKFVEQHKTAGVKMLPGLGKVLYLGGKGRNIVGKALLVANKGIKPVEPWQV